MATQNGPGGLSIRAAWDLVGGLSRTSKMPCYSWGIPAASCLTGSRLASIEGTVCSGCYALRGAYQWSNVSKAYERRLERFGSPQWPDAMSQLVDWQADKTGAPFFRWFDSGDLQSEEMLETIVDVACQTPSVSHWLPTREHHLVMRFARGASLPDNLTVRLSAHMVDAYLRSSSLPTSTVHSQESPSGYACPASEQSPAACGPCRTCWDSSIKNVSYPLH